MRATAAWVLALSVGLAAAAASQTLPPGTKTAAVPAPNTATVTCANNPNALGLTRIVEVDTTGGPGFGFEHFKEHDFLRPKEVVLTFDDGPWPNNTPAVLAALAAHCIKATFFPIGKHTWSHADLSKKSKEEATREIEMGASAVHMAVAGPTAPFFRFPALRHPPEMVTYLGQRNIAIFSCDMDSFDFTMRKPEQVIRSVMSKLEKHGKGIILMHDFQHATAEALPELLNQLKANGYKIVHMVPKAPLQTLAEYDEMVQKENKLPTVSSRPTSSVIRTISQMPH